MGSLNQERPTVTRNFYGSAIEEASDDEEFVDITVEELVDERVYCSCSGKCARKKGKGACPCKAANLSCYADACSCSKAKCKNQDSETDAVGIEEGPRNPDGADRFQNEVEQSATQIQEFIQGLDSSTKDELLVKLLSMGRGSLDFAKQIVEDNMRDNLPEQSISASQQPPWCKCQICLPMDTEQENLCCKKRQCITSYRVFNNICLDRDILEVCIKARCDIRAEEFNFSMESFRKAAYRQFALWKYGKLGRGNRRVIPACAVRMIRQAYPAPDGHYMGFRNY